MQLYPFLVNKPIGAAPGREYHLLKICVVAKRMVRTTINLVGTLHVIRYVHRKRGGNAPQGLGIKRARDDYVGYLILRKPHYC